MKKISDRDLGIDCDHVASGNDEDEVTRLATDHIRKEHPEDFERVRNQIRTKITTA
ncbi:MAG TPA: DUF1059 domain-containing protein [Candidatus Paceibacterota bacterium]